MVTCCFEACFPSLLSSPSLLLLSFSLLKLYCSLSWHNLLPNESLHSTELTVKLEPAFLCGLHCSSISTRTQFLEVFHASIHKKLFQRLLYIACSQNWEHCGRYFWIKHCIEVGVVKTTRRTWIAGVYCYVTIKLICHLLHLEVTL